MDNTSRKLEKYLKKEQEALDAERAREKIIRESDPVFMLNREISENKRLIEEMKLAPGLEVFIKTAKMRGEIIAINPDSRWPISVKREDGEIFPYTPREVEKIIP